MVSYFWCAIYFCLETYLLVCDISILSIGTFYTCIAHCWSHMLHISHQRPLYYNYTLKEWKVYLFTNPSRIHWGPSNSLILAFSILQSCNSVFYCFLALADQESRKKIWAFRPRIRGYLCTLTDLTLSWPGSLLKTTPLPPGYPWVSGGRHVTPEPRFRGLVLYQ